MLLNIIKENPGKLPYRPDSAGPRVKTNVNFYFHTSLWLLKKVEDLFEVLQSNVKIKMYVNFISTKSFETLVEVGVKLGK